MKNQLLLSRSCPVCSLQVADVIHEKKFEGIIGIGVKEFIQKLAICRYCGMVYVKEFFNSEALVKYYALMSNYEFEISEPLMNQSRRQLEFILDNIYLPKSVLDIGCASGHLLGLFKQQGAKSLLGIDASKKCAEMAGKHFGVKVKVGFFRKSLVKKKFDLAVMIHVIEHLDNPLSVLQEISEVLRKDGLLFIETPSIDLFSKVDPYYLSFEHINYFNLETLKDLLNRSGFELVCSKVFPGLNNTLPLYSTSGTLWAKKNNFLKNRKIIQGYLRSIKSQKTKIAKSFCQIVKTEHQVGLWGAGALTAELLSQVRSGKNNIKAIFDNDPKKNGQTMMEIPVIKPQQDMENIKERVNAIIIGSWSSQDEIYESIKFLTKSGIKIYRIFPTLKERGSY